MHHCPSCESSLEVNGLDCPACRLQLSGTFQLPRLARLPSELQQLAEQFILAGGNLKDLAQLRGITYPTLRKHIDRLVAAVQDLRDKDAERAERLLAGVERGEMTAEQAARLIKELQGAS